jgi:hypothetical protein
MAEQVEKVKAAIAEKFAPAIDFKAPYAKVMLDMAARAAIEAMREPTEAMVDAGAVAEGDGNLAVQARSLWDAMIDAALRG